MSYANAEKRVIETLEKISKKFGSANDLIQVITEQGLFEGRAQLYEDGWYIHADVEEFDEPTSWATDGWAYPSFVTKKSGKIWFCSLGYGKHSLILGFDERNGELVHVEPDECPSNRCWAAASSQSPQTGQFNSYSGVFK